MSIKFKKYKADENYYKCAININEGDVLYINEPNKGEYYFLILAKQISYCPYGLQRWEFPVPHYYVKNMSAGGEPTWTTIVKVKNIQMMLAG